MNEREAIRQCMEALQQLTQRQCRHLTIQDLTEMFDTEAVYTKSILHVLETKNLIQTELHYSCPECHSQNVLCVTDSSADISVISAGMYLNHRR